MATSFSEVVAVQESLTAIGEQLAVLCGQLQTTLEQAARIAESSHTSESDLSIDRGEIVFGPWADGDELEPDSRRLLEGLSSGDGEALGLVGRLMIFRAARREQLPPLLKEIGEAFYEWRSQTPDVSDLFLCRLATWLERCCVAAGLRHKIELVKVGDRIDRSRHHAVEPGPEVAEVRGWVVLRDDGTIYTRALVTAT